MCLDLGIVAAAAARAAGAAGGGTHPLCLRFLRPQRLSLPVGVGKGRVKKGTSRMNDNKEHASIAKEVRWV